jgi:hypothetical protein
VQLSPKNILDDVLTKLDRNPDANVLRGVRKTLDDPGFFNELDKYMRGLNNPDTKAEVLDTLIEIHRLCGDRGAARKNNLTNLRYGIGGGIALAGGSIIAIATLGPLAFIPMVGGGWITFLCVSKTGMLSEEEQMYLDMATRAKEIRGDLDA